MWPPPEGSTITNRAAIGSSSFPTATCEQPCAALDQEAITQAPAVFVIAAVYERTSHKYGAARTPRYVHMEVGHAAQNLLLETVALGLGGVTIGAFEDDALRNALSLPADHRPLYLIPVGHPR